MKLDELIRVIEKKFPKNLQYNWDNSGLNIGYEEKNISRILTTLEITEETVDEAIKSNVDLIISHHPFLFSKINKIVDTDVKGKLVIKLIENNIAVYCMHTNYDIAFGGLNDYFLEVIGIENCGVLDPISSYGDYENGEMVGLGRIGKLEKPTTIENFIIDLKERLKLNTIRFVGKNINGIVKNIAVVTGAGAEYFEMIASNDIDVLITGDMKYHQAVDAYEMGVNVLDLGHYGTEYIFSDAMKKYIDEEIGGMEVQVSTKMLNPFIEC
ncbi:Nif3-like dinuclear metal center hexameric protein [Peptostreptococcus porci]|uniref:Nif3-like dinuclear metal center hexameric protein n=1 Tax=Peptostreptococcus porci TaxID=2652282 RepID=UPI002A82E0A9|nr:Nif3-like dinuclear metal center hexameric protein [Peptostreptococcus porci]MDY4129194.1 Nif3-like dinuclear metal center hexameric protein [Peptostreptococcus porci]MDY5436349.1 Nif3-like dinuclear metal center hexameric protein [Peptostreptococcus porci]